MKIGIVCLVYIDCDKHLEIAIRSIKTFVTKTHATRYYLILNKIRDEKDLDELTKNLKPESFSVVYPKYNNFSNAVNSGADLAIKDKCDYILVPNLDTYFFEDTIDNLVEFATQNKNAVLWSPLELGPNDKRNEELIKNPQTNTCPYYSCFMISPSTVEKIGYFDPFFHPAYFEDCDYSWRIDSQKFKRLMTTSSQYNHLGSTAIKKSKIMGIKFQFYKRLNYWKFLLKWGGRPGHEKYHHPFNIKNHDMKKISRSPFLPL